METMRSSLHLEVTALETLRMKMQNNKLITSNNDFNYYMKLICIRL